MAAPKRRQDKARVGTSQDSLSSVLRGLGWVCCLACAGLLLALPPELQPDTASYLSHSPERGPVYPYLLDLFLRLFGQGTGYTLLARFQAAGLLVASAFFAHQVGRALGLGTGWRQVLFLMLALPGLKFASVLLTEPLGYALLIIFWAVFAGQVIEAATARRDWLLAALCGLCLLLRPQMIFLPAFLGLVLLLRCTLQRDRAAFLGLAALLLCLAGATLLRGLDNQSRHGSFATASSGGVHLLSSLLYIAQAEDAAAITDPEARSLFLAANAKAEAAGLTRRQWDHSRAHFDMCMDKLVFEVVRPSLTEALPKDLSPAQAALGADKLAMSAALPLLSHMPGRYMILLARKVYDGQPFYYALALISGGLALALALRTGSAPAQLYAWAVLHSCLAYGVVLLVGVYSLRYILPSEAILLALAVGVGRALLVAQPRATKQGRA
jgi:hypothetical protein